jgi:hypothetical protein
VRYLFAIVLGLGAQGTEDI